jgi:uncharacterized protein (DUF2237 family)
MNILPYFIVIGILYLVYRKTINEKMQGGNSKTNILGTPLVPCSATGKVTGFYRDGNCITGPDDTGKHIVCAVVDDNFLQFTKSMGNDLITPRSKMFPGLVAGDKWCLCVLRWLEAYNAGKAPKIIPESTNSAALEYTTLDILMKYRQILK